jgi:ribonuclease BN (tRNA processing enzyme)
MKKWLFGTILGVLITVTALSALVKYKTGMGPITFFQVKQAGFQMDPAILQLMATAGQPMGRWKEGLMFDGVSPQPWLKSAANWFPGTEDVQPEEIRVTFMGSSPLPRPGQMGTSVYVELGNGKHFIFDFGPGAVANYLAARVPLNQINDIFITHLHWDHFASVPYVYVFGAWAGRWHEKYRIYGPSGTSEKYGIKYMVDRMSEMLTWHKASFDESPIGEGFDLDVHEFDFRDDGGVIYDQDGVKISHWRQSHTEDGASAYRLDWNGMCVAFTGDGRPNSLTIKYAKGCDLLITEIQPETVAISAEVSGAMPLIARNTIDMAHNPAYAAGYLYNQVKPRMAMATHVAYDAYVIPEIVAEVRENWKGPFHFGAPDMVVVNMTKDKIWVRDGVVPQYPNMSPPQFDMSGGGLIVPVPRIKRPDIQEQSIRDAEINPDLYYPKGYKPELLPFWPSDKPVFIPEDKVPEKMRMEKK